MWQLRVKYYIICYYLLKKLLLLDKRDIYYPFNSFSLQDNKLIKIPHKFSLCAVPTTKILIAGQAYI